MHIDMDAFYAAVEQADRPELKGRPVIVGGSHRGVVCAASYEARAYGVRSAMPVFLARKNCPNGIFLPVRMDRYREVSLRVMAAVGTISPLVEQVSIDEAYVDMTGMDRVWKTPLDAARETKRRVKQAAGVTCSVGIAPLKFLAKIASDLNKPDGLTVLSEAETEAFILSLAIEKMPGVGKKGLERMRNMGVSRAGDLLKIPEKNLVAAFGRYGEDLLRMAAGVDTSEVVPSHRAKSVSAENTFAYDLADRDVLKKWLLGQSDRVAQRLRRIGLKGRTVTLKLKRSNFTMQTRRQSLSCYTDETNVIYDAAVSLLDQKPLGGNIRLTGVGVTNFLSEQDPPFWEKFEEREERGHDLEEAVDDLRHRYGNGIIRRASTLDLT
ncbi:MAG: DNA polymerase IV [Deltaproteobacteria bacterium]|nr:DNA polymerase IV [Deltaproteobacteria bacterium]